MRALFVDDDPDTRALAVRAVKQELPSLVVVEATDASGLERALQNPVDILVSDFDLRWSDGFDVLGKVRAAFPDCTAVMFTGTGNEELAVRAMKSGFDDYVVKSPGQLRRLATSVRVAHERRKERRELAGNRELLRQELYHRLHNNLQIVISLMSMTARAVSDAAVKTQLRDLIRRVQVLSALQEQFYRAENLERIDMAGYLEEVLRSDERDDVEVDARLAPVELPLEYAVPLGLIASELLDMAVRSEPAQGADGGVLVELDRRDGHVRLVVSRAGGEPVAAPGEVGRHIVDRLVLQLDGRVTYGLSAGFRAELMFKE